MTNRGDILAYWNGQQFSRRLIGYWIRAQRIFWQVANTYWNWTIPPSIMPHWRGDCTGSLQWKLLALQGNRMQNSPSAEDALRGKWGQNCQHGNRNMTLARRKHSYSKSLGFPILLGNDHSIVRPAWTAHPIRDSGSQTSTQHPATHMLMLHSQPCTRFNTNETTICCTGGHAICSA